MWEQWNKAACHYGQRARIKGHVPMMGGKCVCIWDETVMGTCSSLPPVDCCPNMGKDGRSEGDMTHSSNN
jgi:hypothetical protein